MPKFASYDPTAPLPAPITGWWDTDTIDYPTLPDAHYIMTEAEWDVRMDAAWGFDGAALVELPPPPPTAYQVYDAKIADGIAITSTATPALNGTYPIDATSVAYVGSIARDASSGLGLPNDQPTVPIKDIDGTPHDFGETDVIALYKVERNLTADLAAQRDVMLGGGEPIWPPQTATIP